MRNQPWIPALWLAVCLVSAAAFGHPVWGQEDQLHQPDGTPVDVRVWGDEFYQIYESLDGFTLVTDPETHEVCYARLSEDGRSLLSIGVRAGDSVPTGLRAHQRVTEEAARSTALAARAAAPHLQGWMPEPPAPTTGHVRGIVIPIDFSDVPADVPISEIDAFFHEPGFDRWGCFSSIHDYFLAESGGLLDYTQYIPDTYYRASQPSTYYEHTSDTLLLVREAIQWLDGRGLDFTEFDANGDGILDALTVLYAGSGNGRGSGLSPHAGWLIYNVDGVRTQRYALDRASPHQFSLCHETGHALLDWIDLYDIDLSSSGVGTYCLMGYGLEPCCFLKMKAGWASAEELTAPESGLSLTIGANLFFQFTNPAYPNEYYMIENRQQEGFDFNHLGTGLALWHIDENGANAWELQTPEQHYMAGLVQADGRWDLEHHVNLTDDTDLFSAEYVNECGPTTAPDTSWWSGEPSNLRIHDIGPSGPTMTFSFTSEPPPPPLSGLRLN